MYEIVMPDEGRLPIPEDREALLKLAKDIARDQIDQAPGHYLRDPKDAKQREEMIMRTAVAMTNALWPTGPNDALPKYHRLLTGGQVRLQRR